MTAKDILYKKCAEHDGCFLSGQVGWIVEAMEEYALRVQAEADFEKSWGSESLLNTIGKITDEYRKTHGINLK